MKHPARVIAIGVAVVVIVFGVVLAVTVSTDPTADDDHSPFLGKAAPAFDLPTITGERVSSASTAGKTVIVNFWNTWCSPCQEELPALKAFYARHQNDSDVVMIGIVRDPQESTGTIKSYVADKGMHWTIALDPGNQAALDFATRGQPETLAIAPNGVVAASFYGPLTAGGLERFVAAARAYG